MRHLILRIVVMMLTFASSAGLHYIISSFTVQPIPAVNASTRLVAKVNESSIRETRPPPPPAVVVAPKELSYVVVDYDFHKFVPDGMYVLMGHPKGFREFSSFYF